MLAFEGFCEAVLLEDTESEPDGEYTPLTVIYRVESEENLQNYLNHKAKGMREEGIKRFGNKFRAQSANSAVEKHPVLKKSSLTLFRVSPLQNTGVNASIYTDFEWLALSFRPMSGASMHHTSTRKIACSTCFLVEMVVPFRARSREIRRKAIFNGKKLLDL